MIIHCNLFIKYIVTWSIVLGPRTLTLSNLDTLDIDPNHTLLRNIQTLFCCLLFHHQMSLKEMFELMNQYSIQLMQWFNTGLLLHLDIVVVQHHLVVKISIALILVWDKEVFILIFAVTMLKCIVLSKVIVFIYVLTAFAA